jgi:CubicO group peptidase (beta-lactamase class C family)
VPNDKDHPHPPRHPITIKEILSHTSGMVLASEKTLKRYNDLKQDVAEYASVPLHREPGTKYEYNNDGINTAGRIIEVVSGMSYAEFMQKRLFDPLEMTDTTFWPTNEQAKRLAHGVRLNVDKTDFIENKFDKDLTANAIAKFSKGVPVPQPMLADMGLGVATDYANHYAMPAGGIYSTAADVGRLCQMLLNGGVYHGKRLLSEKAVAQMTSNQTGDVPVSPQEAYGLGWSVKLRDDEGPSVGSFGHRGARRTAMWVDPKNQLVMVVLVERMDMPGDAQKKLYSTFMKTAIEKYGKKGN